MLTDCVVVAVHPSDLGHTRIAEFYESFLPPLLAASDARIAAQEAATDTATVREAVVPMTMAAGHSFATAQGEAARTLQAAAMQQPTSIDSGSSGSATSTPKPGYTYTDLKALGVHGRAFDDTKPGHYYSRLRRALRRT